MPQINWYPGHMAKTRRLLQEQLRAVDAVIELCDARAPHATRNPDLNALCRGKARILVLNKADLANDQVTKLWLDHYKKQNLPAIRFNANGGNEDDSRTSPEFAFDLDSCPVLFIHGDADKWAAMNSVKCWEQLRRMGIQCDLHTLAKRGHCFQKNAAPGTGSYTWMGRIWEFMNHKGFNR